MRIRVDFDDTVRIAARCHYLNSLEDLVKFVSSNRYLFKKGAEPCDTPYCCKRGEGSLRELHSREIGDYFKFDAYDLSTGDKLYSDDIFDAYSEISSKLLGGVSENFSGKESDP